MVITKYGLGLVIGSWLIFLIFLLLSVLFRQPVVVVFTILAGVFSLFNLLFFRDPARTIPDNPKAIMSPADGKIIQITEVMEHDFFNRKVTRISIFLSIFDVHINRAPFSGQVDHFRYQRGAFMPAFKEGAAIENEQTAIGIVDDQQRKVMFTQVAGIIARRIVCTLREGHQTRAGDRMGMIRYGSRADIYFAGEEVDLQVKKGEKVKGGESIIGVFK